ncbi:unnamed protein product [Caenorhabditis auriculariae]|uniref:Uncharacterized protein n=1 Tax=Caenorhabditis auriculariae TaxID=2777116 RepID=A0A8S1GTL6_9PELO|nr:unnamed protein product [Caenorhabditis auriculariae]
MNPRLLANAAVVVFLSRSSSIYPILCRVLIRNRYGKPTSLNKQLGYYDWDSNTISTVLREDWWTGEGKVVDGWLREGSIMCPSCDFFCEKCETPSSIPTYIGDPEIDEPSGYHMLRASTEVDYPYFPFRIPVDFVLVNAVGDGDLNQHRRIVFEKKNRLFDRFTGWVTPGSVAVAPGRPSFISSSDRPPIDLDDFESPVRYLLGAAPHQQL